MGIGCFLAQLHQLVRFFKGKGIEVDPVDRFVKVHCRRAQIATRPIALAQSIITRERIVGIIQERLELANRVIPAFLFLIQPAQEIPRVRPVKTTLQNLLAEGDSIVKTTLGLKGLCLFKCACHLCGCDASTRGRSSGHICRSHCRTRPSTKVACATHITHDARITSA